jgi:AcrR family transcriptional regulator
MKKDYHHGDLRRALIKAAEIELSLTGVEGFSLRRVAKRANVSHAAPAHHFKDAKGLLTAVATEGYARFAEQQKRCEELTTSTPEDRLLAQGVSYVRFADDNKALFRLMFSSDHPDFTNPGLADAAQAAFTTLADAVAAVSGAHPYQDEKAMERANAIWALAHGLAELLSSGRMATISQLPPKAKARMIRNILGNAPDMAKTDP